MNIPEHIKIQYKDYKIEMVDNLHDGADELYGQIQHIPETIYLNAGCSEGQKKSTLLHEALHGLDAVFCIGLKEKQVEKLGSALYMLIHDNPNMFKEVGCL